MFTSPQEYHFTASLNIHYYQHILFYLSVCELHSGFLTNFSYTRALKLQTLVQHFKSCFIANYSLCKTCDLIQLVNISYKHLRTMELPWSCGPRHKSQKCETLDYDSFNAFHSNGIGTRTIEQEWGLEKRGVLVSKLSHHVIL